MARKPTEQLASTGAPANALLLERHAADAESEVMRVKAEIQKLSERLPQADGDPDRTKDINNELQARRVDLNDAYELWFKLSKQVREYDKAVDASRKEGERISKAEAEEFFAQFMLSLNLGHEAAINALAQEAALCDAPEQFCANAAPMIRGCMTSAIADAVRDNKLPAWAKI